MKSYDVYLVGSPAILWNQGIPSLKEALNSAKRAKKAHKNDKIQIVSVETKEKIIKVL